MESPVILTARTRLEPVRRADARAIQRFVLRNRERLATWEPLRDDAYFSLHGCAIRARNWARGFRSGVCAVFLAWNGDRSQIIAQCAFSNIVRGAFGACHLGYAVDGEHEGRGLMREVLQAAIDYAFGEMGLHRIMANYMPRNTRSEQLLLRLGFQKEGYAKSYLRINGRWEDHVLTSLINPNRAEL